MMTTPAAKQLVEYDPLLAGVITFSKRGSEAGISGIFRKARELRSYGFDVAYSLHRSYRTSLLLTAARIPLRIGFKDARLSGLYHRTVQRPLALHEVLRNLSIVERERVERGLESFDEDLRLHVAQPSVERPFMKQLRTDGPGIAVLVPGSVWATKRWNWEGYRRTAQELLASGMQVVLLGSADESEICSKVAEELPLMNLAGQLSLQESMYVIKAARLVVCNDSLALHMASSFKTPAVAVFCATSPAFGFGPWKNRGLVVEQEGLSCKPCRRHGSMRCPTGTEACMKLPAERVIAAAQKVLAGRD